MHALAMVLAGLALASCGDGSSRDGSSDGTVDGAATTDAPANEPAPEESVAQFTWTTSYLGDGSGASVEVTGLVGAGWASYTMHGVPVQDVSGDDEIAALFGPWVGAEGAIVPTGNAAEGEARWGVTYSYEPDGVDGFARGEASWHTTAGNRPDHLPPDSSIDVEQVSAELR